MMMMMITFFSIYSQYDDELFFFRFCSSLLIHSFIHSFILLIDPFVYVRFIFEDSPSFFLSHSKSTLYLVMFFFRVFVCLIFSFFLIMIIWIIHNDSICNTLQCPFFLFDYYYSKWRKKNRYTEYPFQSKCFVLNLYFDFFLHIIHNTQTLYPLSSH